MLFTQINVKIDEPEDSDNSENYDGTTDSKCKQYEDKFSQLVQTLKNNGEVYTDNEFRAGPGSLITNWNEKSERVSRII